MFFTDRQIELACQLKVAGLTWTPQAGQYAFDAENRIGPGSPFQPQVYYFHDLPCFVDYFGSVAALTYSMVWLPTFEEARERAKSLASIRETIEQNLTAGTELDGLYHLIKTEIESAS
jgi:hypothetical protein